MTTSFWGNLRPWRPKAAASAQLHFTHTTKLPRHALDSLRPRVCTQHASVECGRDSTAIEFEPQVQQWEIMTPDAGLGAMGRMEVQPGSSHCQPLGPINHNPHTYPHRLMKRLWGQLDTRIKKQKHLPLEQRRTNLAEQTSRVHTYTREAVTMCPCDRLPC